jgi:hypothetical protein
LAADGAGAFAGAVVDELAVMVVPALTPAAKVSAAPLPFAEGSDTEPPAVGTAAPVGPGVAVATAAGVLVVLLPLQPVKTSANATALNKIRRTKPPLHKETRVVECEHDPRRQMLVKGMVKNCLFTRGGGCRVRRRK